MLRNLPTRISCYLALLLITGFVATAAISTWDESWTADEPVHLVAGLSLIQTGDARLHVDHTPLARLIGALPALFIPMDSVAERSPEAWRNADLKVAYGVLYDMEDRLLRASRLTMLSLSVLLGFLLYRWGSRLFGPQYALLPLALFAFCPPLLANAPMVATDLAITAFMFASVYGWWRYLAAPSPGYLLAVGLAAGAAFATKHTAVLLAPVLLLTGAAWLIPRWQGERRWRNVGVVLAGWLGVGLAVLLMINLVYLFDGFLMTPPEYLARINTTNYLGDGGRQSLLEGLNWLMRYWPTWLPIPLPYYYVAGALARLSQISGQGQFTYFLGEASDGGWPNYFLVMLLIKLSIPALLLIGLGALAAIRRLPRSAWDLSFLLLPVVLLVWTSSLGKMQIGIRHMLPAFPFLFLLTGYALQACQRRAETMALLILAGLNAFSSLAVHPHYLMYYNFLAGGPDQGWRISVNGDDWGQSDRALTRWLQAKGAREVAYDGFAWGNNPLNRGGIRVKNIPCSDTGELVAFHIGLLLVTSNLERARCYEWLKLRKPDEKIGYNIFLYNTRNISRVPRPSPPANLDLFRQALDFQRRGNNLQAIALYRQYLTQEPDYYQAHFNLAYALMKTGQCAAAIPEFERTLQLWPGYDEVHSHLKTCRQELSLQEQTPAQPPNATPAEAP